MSFSALIRKPSAFLPVAMSLGAITALVGHLALVGMAREADEGTAAHVFQLLMAAQVPIIGYFAIRWLPQGVRPALQVLVLQAVAALAALVPVFLLEL